MSPTHRQRRRQQTCPGHNDCDDCRSDESFHFRGQARDLVYPSPLLCSPLLSSPPQPGPLTKRGVCPCATCLTTYSSGLIVLLNLMPFQSVGLLGIYYIFWSNISIYIGYIANNYEYVRSTLFEDLYIKRLNVETRQQKT